MTTYRERLTPPASWWVACAVLAAVSGWIVLVATTRVAAVVAALVVLVGAVAVVARYGAVTVTRTGDGLRVGPAFLDEQHLGTAEALHRVDYRRRMGVDADVRAHLVTRPYLDRGVLVTVDDPSDPTPYWIVSSRRPDALAAAINDHLTRQEAPRGQET